MGSMLNIPSRMEGPEQKTIIGKPEITISSKGIANSTSIYLNDGADFGPDTKLGATTPRQYGPPYTTTNGIAEWINAHKYTSKISFISGDYDYYINSPLIFPANASNGGSYLIMGPGFNNIIFPSLPTSSNFITINTANSPEGEFAIEDVNIQPVTNQLNALFVSSSGFWMRRCYLYGLSNYMLYVTAGSIWVDETNFDFWSSAAIYLDTATGGPFWVSNSYFGNGMTNAYPSIYIANGEAGGYVFQGCNFTSSTIGIQVEGTTTDLLATMCEFDGSTGIILNATINTSSIIGNSFTAPTPITFGTSFYPNKLRIQNNPGLNPFGLLATPFTTTVPSGGSAWMGPGAPSGTAAPVASTSYRVEVCDQIITSSGGTSVSITIKDAAGNTLLSGATTLTNYYLAAGWSIDFGAFTAAPTTTVMGL